MSERRGEGAHSGGFSPVVGACFTLNYIMGTGFLTLPFAFHEAGLALSTVVMVIICVAAKFGSDYTLSAMARAEHLASQVNNSTAAGEARGAISSDEFTSCAEGDGKKSSLGNPPATETDEHEGGRRPGEKPPVQADEKGMLIIGPGCSFDLPELCRIFLGSIGVRAYGVANGLHIYGLLWVYTAVFASAMERAVPLFGVEGGDSYPMWVLIYAALVIPMSVMDLSEQRLLQVFLSWCRVVIAVLMIVTPIAAALVADRGVATIDVVEERVIAGNPHFGDQLKPLGSPMFRFAGFPTMFTILSFSTVFHHAVPMIASEISDKLQVGRVFSITLFLCGIAFCLIGSVGAWYFGDRIEQSANLNWDEYHAGTGRIEFDEIHNQLIRMGMAWWANLISLYVVLFPALDVLSVFPLNALCLGKTLENAFLGSGSNADERKISIMFRFFACYPPIIGALFVRQLGLIASFTGVFGILIQFCFPALLYIASERQMVRLNTKSRTHYEGFGSSVPMAKAVFAFGAVSTVLVFVILCIGIGQK